MAKTRTRKRKTHMPGLDPFYVLAVKFRKGRPTKFLVDQRVHPGDGPDTTIILRARRWADSSGPRHYLRLHPKLRKQYVSFRVYELLVPDAGPAPRLAS